MEMPRIVGRMGAVAETVAERLDDQRLLDLRHGLADEGAGGGVGGVAGGDIEAPCEAALTGGGGCAWP